MSIRSRLMATFAGMSILIGLVALIAVNRQFVAGEAAAVAEAQDAARIIANAIAGAPTDAPSQAPASHSFSLQEYVTELQQRLDRHVVVVDRGERILANAGHEVLGPVYDLDPHDEIAQTISDGIPRTFAEKDLSHPEYNLHVVVPLQTGTGADTLGAVVLDYSHSYQEMRSIAARSLTIVVAAASAGVLLSLVLSYRVSRSIAGPLAQLSAGFARLAAGQDDARVEVRSRDEIGSLTRGFNAMVDDLNQSRSRLERQAADLTRKYEELSEEIDKRKRAETKLSEQEEAYRTLAENLPGIVFRLHLREDQRLEFFNRAALPTIGSDSNELGKGQICPCESLMVSEDRAKVATTVEQAIITNQPYSLEYRWMAANGELRHMLERGTPVQGTDGEPLFVDGVILDITEQVQAQEALAQSEARFRAQFSNIPIPTYTWQRIDGDFVLVDFNDAAQALTSGRIADYVGITVVEMYPSDPQIAADFEQCFRQQTVIRREMLYPFQHRSGTATFVIHYVFVPPDLVMVHTEDITPRKQAEKALIDNLRHLESLWAIDRAILNAKTLEEIAQAALPYIRDLGPFLAANVALFDWNAQQARVLATANTAPAAFEVGDRVPLEAFGDLADLMQGRPFLVADIGDLAHITPKVDVLLDRGIRSYISLPMRVRGELVGTLNLGAAAPAEFTEENTDLACQVADSLAIAVQNAWLFDRTQAARKRLQKLTHHLVEAQEQERHRLARELHDEIGQALTAIKISLQTAQRRADMSAANPQLEESIAIVDRALQQLRDVSLDLRPSLLDDLGLVATLRWYLDRHTQSGELRTSLQVEPPDLHLPSALEVIVFRVVQEALTNVMRHARAQNVEVKLQLDAEAVELTVRDDGVSFDLQDALDSAMAGTSMGLLGMQERVALAGGHIDIVSAPGRGTEIRVRFPVAP